MKVILIFLLIIPQFAYAWKNGQSGNASTDQVSECSNPPYSTHDWIADKAFAVMPTEQVAWLAPHRTMLLLGTEAPDNDDIPTSCNGPNTGYDDKNQGHSVEWEADLSGFVVRNGTRKDRAADRAQEEYEKAVTAYRNNNLSDAAFYLGAMAHYIGDVSQYGHSYPDETIHSLYEGWVGRRTKQLNGTVFDDYIVYNGSIRRRPYTAVKRISKATFGGRARILPATEMDAMYRDQKDTIEFKNSVGDSLNLAVNEMADVLYYFWVKEVQQ